MVMARGRSRHSDRLVSVDCALLQQLIDCVEKQHTVHPCVYCERALTSLRNLLQYQHPMPPYYFYPKGMGDESNPRDPIYHHEYHTTDQHDNLSMLADAAEKSTSIRQTTMETTLHREYIVPDPDLEQNYSHTYGSHHPATAFSYQSPMYSTQSESAMETEALDFSIHRRDDVDRPLDYRIVKSEHTYHEMKSPSTSTHYTEMDIEGEVHHHGEPSGYYIRNYEMRSDSHTGIQEQKFSVETCSGYSESEQPVYTELKQLPKLQKAEIVGSVLPKEYTHSDSPPLQRTQSVITSTYKTPFIDHESLHVPPNMSLSHGQPSTSFRGETARPQSHESVLASELRLTTSSRALSSSMSTLHVDVASPESYPSNSSTPSPSRAIRKEMACQYCGKSFHHTGDLNKHIRTHTKERPYPCNQCSKSFTHASNLLRHQKIHTGEKPYKCPDCDRAFNRKDKLACHKKTAHERRN